jgi:signal transduction histidine kinase
MNRTRATLALALGLAIGLPALSTLAAEPTGAVAKVAADVEITVEEAKQDDILLVIDLPIIIAEARDAGVDDAELTVVVTTATDAGLSASETAEVIVAETEHTKTSGKRAGLGTFVQLQLAEGVRGQELAAKLREQKAELAAELTAEQKAAWESKIVAMREKNKARRLALAEKRKELRTSGTVIVIVGKDLHDARKAALVARKAELEEARREHFQAKKENRGASAEAHEAIEERKEAREELKDAKDDLKAADTPEERKEAREDLKDAKADLKDAKADAKDAKKDSKDAKKDLKDAKADHKDAKHDVAKDKKAG